MTPKNKQAFIAKPHAIIVLVVIVALMTSFSVVSMVVAQQQAGSKFGIIVRLQIRILILQRTAAQCTATQGF